jgi:uncharacterized membrane protein
MPFSQELFEYSKEWVSKGIISENQRTEILNENYTQKHISRRLIPILSVLGAAMVVLGIISVISANWDNIPSLIKLISGIVLMVLFYSTGYILRFRSRQLLKTGNGLILAGSGMFFANTVLIGQQYNLSDNSLLAFWLTFLVTFLLTYFLMSRIFGFVSAVLLITIFILSTQQENSIWPAEEELLVFIILGLSVWLLIISIINRLINFSYLSLPFETIGGVSLYFSIFYLGFLRHFDIEETLSTINLLVFLLLPAFIFVLLLASSLNKKKYHFLNRINPSELSYPYLTTYSMLILLLIFTALVGGFSLLQNDITAEIFTISYWLFFIMLCAVTIWIGLLTDRGFWINGPLIFIGIFVLTRYFDLFSSYDQTGLLFIGAGILFFVLAFVLERTRKIIEKKYHEN